MATVAPQGTHFRNSYDPDRFERILAIGAVILLFAAGIAILRGRPDWPAVPPLVWLHLATIAVALALTPVMLLRRRGDSRHRLLGTVWVGAMLATAVISLGIRLTNNGNFSIIHILSIWTLVQVPILWWTARKHQVVRHRRAVRGMVTGALLIAGFFTFPFDRLLGRWLFG
ncbi:MAG: hypothetical protein OSB00_03650 [Sphingomonas bacterium]|nr:hypothetical protein [Sphingomonas bacterium]